MSGIVERLINEVKNSRRQPDRLVVSLEEAGELADHFFNLRKMRGSGFDKEDIEEMIRVGRVSVVGIPVEIAT